MGPFVVPHAKGERTHMSWLTSQDTYVRTVKSPDGETAKVTFRYLSGYERNRLQSMRATDEGASLDMGSLKATAIDLAVVRWTLPFDKTPENIRNLQGDVFDRLFEYVSLDGKEPPEEPGEEDLPLESSEPATSSGEPSGSSD
jgi:hypothetical protein